MTPEEQIKNLMTGIGAIGETLHVFYSSCVNSGFDEDKAMALTITFLTNLMGLTNRKGDSNDS